MEKKASLHNATVVTTTVAHGGVEMDAIPKHQHNVPPQYQLRYMQQSLKIPNNQQRHSPMIQHMHPQSYQQTLHARQMQSIQQSMQPNKLPSNYSISPNIHNNPLHMHYNNQYIYQQTKLKQQPSHHQHQQQPASPLSPIYQSHQHVATYQHNPNLTPQPWVPPHTAANAVYQSQNQIEPGTPTTTTSSTNTMNTNMNLNTTNVTPVHNKHRELERKKSGSGHTQLRSPSAKRPSDAPVTLQGWLHKQGSDGLMLWKKRWFVLSEYVLFYYKGPEEEKLLGSVLLPSYRVSICGPEDRANKKYAFKCEHTNMRTYVLAADTQELMMQWARALNLASLLQTNIESDSSLNTPSSTSYNLNETIESNYGNTHTNPIMQQPQSQQGQSQPQPQSQAPMRLPLHAHNTHAHTTHAHSSSNATDFSNPSQDFNQYNQPLYANAPPKPRRLNDTGYSSPSPENLDRYNEPKYVTLQPPQYMRNTSNISKSNSVYSQDSVYQTSEYQGHHPGNGHGQYSAHNSTERRTPDTYGRSKNHQAHASMLNGGNTPQNGRHPSDYEDIYAEQYMYKRPLSPLAYNKSISITPQTQTSSIQRSYTPMSITRSDSRDITRDNFRESRDLYKKSPNSVPRPHSADFLEYEATHRLNQVILNPQPARPKSSLDINRNGDGYFYSEERYAEKMRKSAQYLSKMPPGSNSGKYSTPTKSRHAHEFQDNTFPLMRSSTGTGTATTPLGLGPEYGSVRRESLQPTRCRSVLSEGSISKELDGDLYGSQYKEVPGGLMAGSQQPDGFYAHGQRYPDNMREYDPFTRSASARLANIEQRLQGDGRASMNKEGERKREESMKRLLEWKQRMLQSPLNRKVNQNVNKTYSKPEYYKRASSYARHVDGRSGMIPYNNYSSDDEENASARITKAGRTAGTLSPAPYTPISFDTPQPQIASNTLSTNDLSDAPPDTSTNHMVPQQCTPTAGAGTTGTLVKNILAEFSKLTTKSPTLESPQSQSCLVSPRTPTFAEMNKDIDAIIEENYMIMTPKKNTFDFARQNESMNEENEENPYVEMTQGLTDLTSTKVDFDIDSGGQSYELVTFGLSPKTDTTQQTQVEPLYMELQSNKSKTDIHLPDLLPVQVANAEPQIAITDDTNSEDADDEASKDLESLYSTKRFSLSDVFRPASYYLGARDVSNDIQTLPEQEYSSDSELVSPPPIPRSPPPMEDFDKTNKASEKDTLSISSVQTDTSDILDNLDYVRNNSRFKRRPVSEEYRDEVESLDSEFNSTDIKKYLKIDENSIPEFGNRNTYHDYENMIVTKLKLTSLSPPKHKREVSNVSKDSQGHSVSHSEHSLNLNDEKDNLLTSNSAPYYYSDLGLNMNTLYSPIGMLKLNNQRGTNNGGKRDITHIVNPIRNIATQSQGTVNDFLQQYKLPNDLALGSTRSASVDFLNLTDKSGHIDKKNVYESDTLKRLKVEQHNPELRNVYPKTVDKFLTFSSNSMSSDVIVRRTHSLEGLLNVLDDNQVDNEVDINEGSYLWEEDSIWRETLRNASQRHTKSLDDLDCLGTTSNKQVACASVATSTNETDLTSNVSITSKVKKPVRPITRDVVYVNDTVYNMPVQEKYVAPHQLQSKATKSPTCAVGGSTEAKKRVGNFIIDREKLRQWDLMSSAPSDGEQRGVGPKAGLPSADLEFAGVGNDKGGKLSGDRTQSAQVGVATAVPLAQEAASGSLSMFAHNMAAMATYQQPIDHHQHQSRSTSNLHRSYDSDYGIWQDYYLSPAPSQQNIEAENRKIPWNAKVKLSAGDLLGRTHEELVLLLIQLRRQSTNVCHAIESGYNEIDNIQAQLHLMDAAKRMESLQKLEQIKQHLLDLEKQYEKGKPMVNLVDNMVKLGSLYKFPSSDRSSSYSTRDRIEFNQQMQEKKLLDDERRDWNRINSNHLQLQEKVQQLYELDQLIQEGSGTLQGLQQDKEDIERALGGIRNRLMQGYNDPEIIEKAKKQQAILENELSRVHLMLAQNSKKLEETVAGNARLEQELLVLRQKLQASKQSQSLGRERDRDRDRASPQFSNPGDSLTCGLNIGNNGAMESDLQKVQQKVGDLQKQRQELSMQVRQLTDRSSIPVKAFSPTQQDGKKKIHSGWRETDLDTMYIRDHGEASHWESTSSIPSSIPSMPSTNYGYTTTNTMSPLYIKTADFKNNSNVSSQQGSTTPDDLYGVRPSQTSYNSNIGLAEPLTPDDYSSPQFTMPLPQEKQEIKTVRIVKRESERRHRDRDRDKIAPNKYDALLEDDFYTTSTSSPTRPTTLCVGKASSSTNLTYPEDNLSRTSSTPSISQFEKDSSASPVLSPVFKSEAARQIITEIGQETPKLRNQNRRAVPIEKRRHYTAPHNNLIRKSFNQLPTTDDDTFNKAVLETRRARDDLDMERALRQRIDAPDVVRSTLSSKELKYTENTIDNLFGAPNKIFIPERYIPEQTPQLSAEEEEHRLRKVESIKKMLSDTTILSTSTANLANGEEPETSTSSATSTKATTKMIEEKKQREHLLQLNQILAKQVMEMSKIVAVKALSKLESGEDAHNSEDEDSSPISPLPLYQQRDNFYS